MVLFKVYHKLKRYPSNYIPVKLVLDIPFRNQFDIFAWLCLTLWNKVSQEVDEYGDGEDYAKEYVRNKQISVLSEVTIMHSECSHIGVHVTRYYRAQDFKEVPAETKHRVSIQNDEFPNINIIILHFIVILIGLYKNFIVVKQILRE